MLGRMASKAEVVMTMPAVEDAIDIAEEADLHGSSILIYLIGRVMSDCNGAFIAVEGASVEPDGAVGMCVSSPEGGVEPDDSQKAEFIRMFPQGVLMVVDPCAGEFSLYVVENGDVRRASALLSG